MSLKKLIATQLGLAIALLLNVHAQTTSDPAGILTTTINGAGISLVHPTLANKVEFQGPTDSPGGVSANTFTVTGGFVGLDFVTDPHFVELTSGPNAGVWTDITANTDDDITTADDLSSLASDGDTILIRKHRTIGDVFGADTPTAVALGFVAAATAPNADRLQIIEPGGGTVTNIHLSNLPSPFDGWTKSDFTGSAANIPIPPGQGVLTERGGGGGDLALTVVGHVKIGPTSIAVEEGINILATPIAIGTPLGGPPAAFPGLWDAATDALVVSAGTAPNADRIQTYLPTVVNIHNSNLPAPFDGWILSDFTGQANAYVIPEGTAMIYERQTAGAGGGAANFVFEAAIITQ